MMPEEKMKKGNESGGICSYCLFYIVKASVRQQKERISSWAMSTRMNIPSG